MIFDIIKQPGFLAPGISFMEFFHRSGKGEFGGMIETHCIYCTLYLYYYYISSISDHQTLDPGGWDTYKGYVWWARAEKEVK